MKTWFGARGLRWVSVALVGMVLGCSSGEGQPESDASGADGSALGDTGAAQGGVSDGGTSIGQADVGASAGDGAGTDAAPADAQPAGDGGVTEPDAGSGDAAVARPDHIQTVFVIVMENHNWDEITPDVAPYIRTTLLPKASYATNYSNPPHVHPSEPNYIWMEAGDNFGIHDDKGPRHNHLDEPLHLVALLDAAGISWRSYQQGISGDVCPIDSTGDYAPKHNPMIFFDDVNGYDPQTDTFDLHDAYCVAHNRPLSELETDLAQGTVARYNFITPDLCHDMHDNCGPGKVEAGDAFLAEWVPKIEASKAYQEGGVLFVTWDESEPSGSCLSFDPQCPIGMIVLSPLGKGGGYHNDIAYDHSSLLKTIEEIFGVTPLLRAAGDPATEDLADLFQPGAF